MPVPLPQIRWAFLAVLVTTALPACQQQPAPVAGGGAAFVTLLGEDTLAVERFAPVEGGMEATVVLRTPETTVRHYRLNLGPDGAFQELTTRIEAPGAAAGAPALREERVTMLGADQLVRRVIDGDDVTTDTLAATAEALPFIDMIHWPFDLALQRARAAQADSVVQPLFAGRRVWDFMLQDLAPDSMTITHPFRGTMGVTVDDEGRLVLLDAAGTTRKLTVRRQPDVDIEALAAAFAARDAAGEAFGPLSGRGEAVASVGPATLTVDYGTPVQRGRDLFGALVPYGEVWRTGANRATHFSTDRTIRLGDLTVPAGDYTLYTIPEPDGGLLLVNRQTGQGGTTYNADRDLGRVPMTRTTTEAPVEVFTIDVEATGTNEGTLRLLWGDTAYTVPVTVP